MLNNYNEFLQECANEGTFTTEVSNELLQELIDKKVDLKVLAQNETSSTIKVYE